MFRLFKIFLIVFSLSACQNELAQRQKPISSDIYFIAPNVGITLPSIRNAPTKNVQQLLIIYTPAVKKEAVVIVLSLSPEKLDLSLLSSIGIKLAQLTYDGSKIIVLKSLPSNKFTPVQLNQVVGDILVSNLQIKDLNMYLPEKWHWLGSDFSKKLFNPQGDVVMQITCSDRQCHHVKQIKHFLFDYTIDIQDIALSQ